MVCLPDGLNGEFNLLLVGYGPWHWWQFDSWLPFVRRLEGAFRQFRFYIVPVIEFGRMQIPTADLPTQVSGTRVLTIDSDHRRLREWLDIISELNISALLVKRDGTILWRESGVWTTDKADSLDSVLLSVAELSDPSDD